MPQGAKTPPPQQSSLLELWKKGDKRKASAKMKEAKAEIKDEDNNMIIDETCESLV